ncbi:hypothetical protein V8F20_011423 [Naviculisporaceae sp. PSN 640]
MDHPPSYLDATRRQDWLELVAPYVSVRDYTNLCLVSKRFYDLFAPRLWHDPLTAARTLGLVQQYDYEWYFRFMLKHMPRVRTSTRALVTTVDLRGFALDVPRLSVEFGDVHVNQTLRLLPSTFPWLRYILLDGHGDVDAGLLATPVDPGAFRAPGFEAPLLLSVPSCQIKIASSFFASPYLQSLVYLDISDVIGSIQNPVLQRRISPRSLPRLRILKARGRGLDLDDTATYVLLESFKTQLWSLDISGNRITDELLPELVNFSFPPLSIRTGVTRFNIEGILSFESSGHNSYGKHAFIQESQWSGSFSHPQRHLADAPVYTRNAAQHTPQGATGVRSDGRVKIRCDSVDAVKCLLTEGLNTVPAEHVYDLDICRDRGGLTHLYLNKTSISSRGLGRLIRESPGQLERLECSSPLVTIPPKGPPEPALPQWLGKKPQLYGAIGIAHLFRPVWSSNLQVLRIHHSFVTQVLTLTGTTLPTMENIWLAETCLLPRAVLAYPQAFVPDMNPRLRSLTLTQIPLYSTGYLIDKLIGLLKLASIQEGAIQDSARETSATLNTSPSSRYGPSMLPGLRHIHFQFEIDPRLEKVNVGDEDMLDAEDFGMSSDDFSFFANDSGGGWGVSSSSAGATPSTCKSSSSTQHEQWQRQLGTSVNNPSSCSSRPQQQGQGQYQQRPQSARLASGHGSSGGSGSGSGSVGGGQRLTAYPYSETTDEYIPHMCTWNGVEYTLPVWIGSGILSASSSSSSSFPTNTEAVNEYMRNLCQPSLLSRVEPASPAHVLAGVPEGSFIFSDAWDAILSPLPSLEVQRHSGIGKDGLVRRPRKEEVSGMRDVIEAIKEYRKTTRRAFEEYEASLISGRERGGDESGGKKKGEIKLGAPHFYYTGRVEISIEDTISASNGGGERR